MDQPQRAAPSRLGGKVHRNIDQVLNAQSRHIFTRTALALANRGTIQVT